jgi:hypothetical protein
MEAALEWAASADGLGPELKTELGEKLAAAKAESENAIFALERSAKASSDKCVEQAATIEALETRARTAEARAAASELKETELRSANEK